MAQFYVYTTAGLDVCVCVCASRGLAVLKYHTTEVGEVGGGVGEA